MRILSLNGGGIRGVIQAAIIEKIEEYTGRPIMDDFDIVIGTSTGGILATGLTHPKGFRGKDIVALYVNNAKRIFSHSSEKSVKNLWGWLDNSYSNKGIISVFKELYGETLLSEHPKRCITTVFDLERYIPFVFDSETEQKCKSWEAAVSTAAAPTYFEPLLINGISYVDGGVCGLNDPSAWIVARVLDQVDPAVDVKCLSIGTGIVKKKISHDKAVKWGKAEWVKHVIDIQMKGSQCISQDILSYLLGDDAVSLNPKIDEKLSPMDGDKNVIALRDIGYEYFETYKDNICSFIDDLNGKFKSK